MRWLTILSVGCATAACGNLAWTLCRAWVAWTQHIDPPRAEARYAEPTGEPESPFAELDGGGRIAEHARGWMYDQALFLPDIDGDGCADLALAARRPSMCGNDTEGELEIYSGARLTLLGEYTGPVLFSLEASPRGALLETRVDCNVRTEASVRDDLRSERRWSRYLEVLGGEARFVGDLDRDGHEDVASACSWAPGDEGVPVGEVRVHSGRNGRPIWTEAGGGPAGFGTDVAPAGDWDRDGCPDLAVLADRSIVILSGRGEPIGQGELLRSGDWIDLSGAGDLDGDGRLDFCCRDVSGTNEQWVVFSSRTWQPLDVADGWRILWCVGGGDLNGDGLDDLAFGRFHDDTGERRVSVHSAAGLVDVRLVGDDEPAWEYLGTPGVGRFRKGEPCQVLLPMWNGVLWQGRGFTVIYPVS